MKCEISVVYIVYTCKASKIELHQSTTASTWWCGPQPQLGSVKKTVGLPKGPSYTGHSHHTNHFLPCCPLNDRRKVARSLFEIGLSSLFSCLSLARLLILLLLLMSGNVHPNPCLIFSCLVCAENVTWRGRSVQCCTCSNWVHLKCSLLSFSRFKTLGSSHSWSCPSCCVPAVFGDSTPTGTVTSSSDSSTWYTSTAESGPSGPLLLMQHLHPTLVFKPLILFPPTLYLLPLHSHHRLMLLAVSLYLPLLVTLPDSLRVLQWNAGGLRARSTKLLYYISSHPVDLFCIQESNLNLSSSFRIPGFSALRSDCSHSRSGIFLLMSQTLAAASGRQGLSFSELSTFSLSSLDPYSHYAEVNISVNDSSSLTFLNVYGPSIRSSPKDSRTNFFSPSIFPSFTNFFILGDFNCHHSF